MQAEGLRFELRAGCAVALAMILHELATNAAKYGAWSKPEGRVTVNWQLQQADGEQLVLEWAEHDGPAARAPEMSGFGLRFTTRSVKHELHTREGFFPLERPVDQPISCELTPHRQ